MPFLLLIICLLLDIMVCKNQITDENCKIDQKTFTKLSKFKNRKKKEVLKYLHDMQNMAYGVHNDGKMLDYFKTIKKKKGRINLHEEFEIKKYYVNKYSMFFDILFVDTSGYVLHSIKKESDYHSNLFNSHLAETELVIQLKQRGTFFFTEYEFYAPSGEPAGFFSIPIFNSGVFQGWFLLQCSINRINKILVDRTGMGRTGEVYLVNSNKVMLSESRFIEDGTILKQKVDTKAVKIAFKNSKGEAVIRDYRDVNVYSSFERLEVFGTAWIIIAEIDQNEIYTEYYKDNKKKLLKKILKYLDMVTEEGIVYKPDTSVLKRVDMNEYVKSISDTMLYTLGLSTCTAVAVMKPGSFAYLAHIPPTDDIYVSSRLTKYFLKDHSSNMLNEIIKKIKYYDVYPFEFRKLAFVITINHTKSIEKTIDTILENGSELSNIKVVYTSNALGADVYVDIKNKNIIINWYEESFMGNKSSSMCKDLQKIVMQIIENDV